MVQPVAQISAAPAPAVEVSPAKASADDDASEGNYDEVKSPMIGTFYRSASPDKPPFVTVGDDVKKGDVLCIIEAMKLFNEIESEVSGKIIKVLIDDSSPAEYDQPLFLIEPA
jgi:acetyl-CoA carboxylase biotin carboxyl carrier protein